jgi:amino acid transporter
VLSEVKNPRRTLRIAAPLAIAGVTVLYVLANVAYFAAIPKSDLATSEVLVAGLFFRNMFGPKAGGRVLPAFVALSNLGKVIAVSFAHSRVNQEFAKEGLLPFSRFWASNKPLGGPAAAVSRSSPICEHYLTSYLVNFALDRKSISITRCFVRERILYPREYLLKGRKC